MAVTTYTPPAGRVILNTWAALGSRCVPQRVYLMQYDEGLPIVACALYKDGQPYAVPTGADVRLPVCETETVEGSDGGSVTRRLPLDMDKAELDLFSVDGIYINQQDGDY